MLDGTIVFPAQYQDPPDKKRTPHSTIIYSRDHGQTWHCGTAALDNTTESAVAEIEPGVLMLNCRYDLKNRRVVMITRDLGRTWEEHPTSRKTLEEPGACMGSLLGPVKGGDHSFLLFSNPNAERGPRRRMSIKASVDKGLTWPAHWHTLLDAGNSAGYSCLTMVDDRHVGILFEGSRAHMSFLRIPLSELTHVPERHRPSASEDLRFDHVGRGLAASDSQPPRHFEIAGGDGVYHTADAVIKGSTVVVSNEATREPRNVRYGWIPFPKPPVSFFNREGLPASPFTTETSPGSPPERSSEREGHERPNVLLIVSEDNGADLGGKATCYHVSRRQVLPALRQIRRSAGARGDSAVSALSGE
jgi:hypothetical protein